MDEFLKLPIWEYFWNIILLLIPVVPTYLVTRYSLLKPSKLEIKKKQFHNVYLPLYKLFRNYDFDAITYNQIVKSATRMKNILMENYELVFPQLHDLNEALFKELKNNQCSKITLDNIIYQINIDYESLKHELGYPSLNWWTLFKRMRFHDKFVFIMKRTLIINCFISSIVIVLLFLYPNTTLSNFLKSFIYGLWSIQMLFILIDNSVFTAKMIYKYIKSKKT